MRIGDAGWVEELRATTASLGDEFWADFSPCDGAEIQRLEEGIGRALPVDFVEFYRTIGFGQFSEGGGIWSPDEILSCLGAPIYFIVGSMTPGEEWCSEEAHRRLWLTRGAENPVPSRLTEDVLTLDGIRLYDLLQVGSNGCCCYHQLYVGPAPNPIGYCLLTDYQTIEDVSDNFSTGLEKILNFYLMDQEDEDR